MTPAAQLFSIRALAGGGTTHDDLRTAVLSAGPEAHLVLLQGQAAEPHFLAICPNCGQAADSRLTIRRYFILSIYNSGDSGNDTEPTVGAVDVPFCSSCVQQHGREQIAPSPWTPVKRLVSESEGPAGIGVMAIAGMFFWQALIRTSLFPFFLGCFPVMIGLWLIWPVWKKSAYMSLPEPTKVDLAIDFTPNLGLAYEPGWRAFQFRSRTYAEQFRVINAGKLWTPRSAEAVSAAALRAKDETRSNWIAWVGGAALLFWILWKEVLKDLVMPRLGL